MMKRTYHGHGSSSDPTYSKYQAMKQRCVNPQHKSYADYGGRGITVCDRWIDSFELFLVDMGPAPDKMTIERNESDKGYEPGNCRWATKQEQNRNTRRTIKPEIGGVKYETLGDACVALGLPGATVRMRLRYGWTLERALTTPVDTTKRRLDQKGAAA
jgi:hypothetical protein